MRKIFYVLFLCIIMSALCACSAEIQKAEETTEENAGMSELEEQLFDYIVKMSTESFFDPSAVRLLEVGDHVKRHRYTPESDHYGPDTIVLRLQGENRVGGTTNQHFMVCLTTAQNEAFLKSSARELIIYMAKNGDIGDQVYVLTHEGNAGDFVQLKEDYSIVDEVSYVDVGNINRALAEYWESMGF